MSQRPDGARPQGLGVAGILIGVASLGLGVLGLIRIYRVNGGESAVVSHVFAWGMIAIGITQALYWFVERGRDQRRAR